MNPRQFASHADPALLDARRFPLRGSRLIEASAGTGKTFTIAALYLRLVLGHGGDAAFARPLTPPEILVVTFTEAATQELRDRIRARLAQAADYFGGTPDDDAATGADPFLQALRADFEPAQWPACARLLRQAAEWMDEASVSTIHGWCHRMLREHAFDSGSLFSQQLETDSSELLAEAARDYWRSFFAPLAEADARQIAAWWKTPVALLKEVRRLLPVIDRLAPGQPPADALAQAREATGRGLEGLKAPWRGDDGWAAELLPLLDRAVKSGQCKMPARKDWMRRLRDWAEGDARVPKLSELAWARLSPTGMAEGWSGDTGLHSHPALSACEALRAAIDALDDGRLGVLQHATHWMQQRLAREKSRRALMGFDDLLEDLDAALRGPGGARLAAVIRQQFPAALIDEFQDTDPLQYRIFDAIYGVAHDRPEQALVLIGDPKQAIYAFRGADIHTYLRARTATAGRHSTLGTNYRSTTAMVGAVNRLFLRAEAREEGEGAFLFRTPAGNTLPFFEVRAQGRSERLCIDGHAAPALVCWTLEPASGKTTVGSGEATRAMAGACASEIVRLLNLGTEGRAGLAHDSAADTAGRSLRRLHPGDIAVLVNNGHEARAVRQALAARRVRSVYLSDKGSVFHQAVAGDLQRLLQACAEPHDDRLLRAALGTSLLDLEWAELDRLQHDELRFEERVLQFKLYQQAWRRQGVLPMIRRLLHDFGVPARLITQGDERGLTDLLHLSELLQQASGPLHGEHALVRWLAEQRADPGEDQEARKLRLESDADLVKVVTVHKSKGLEYELVFLPFATAFRAPGEKDSPLQWHDEQGQSVVALQAQGDALARVDRERLGEDLRKLYVALTRARQATWVGVAPLAQVERSALGYLLGGGRSLAGTALHEALAALAAPGAPAAPGEGDASIRVTAAPRETPELLRASDDEPAPKPEPPLPAGPREHWWIASYSALRHAGEGAEDEALAWPGQGVGLVATPEVPASAEEDIHADSRSDIEDAEASPGVPGARSLTMPAAPSGVDGSTLHGFPRGSAAGTFLHGLLEWIARRGFGRVQQDPALQADLQDLIARRCNLQGWPGWIEPLRAWLMQFIRMPLDLQALAPPAARRASLKVAPSDFGRVQVEMEFWCAADQVDVQLLDALVRRHTQGGALRPAVAPQQLNGMLKGFIDLVFEHQGRYYIVDYKSNWLGPRDTDYASAALRSAVLSHRYELQYVLYLLALHRHLRARLADYDYDRHIGGAAYLFLRGHGSASQGVHAERPPRALIEAIDALFEGRRVQPADVESAIDAAKESAKDAASGALPAAARRTSR